MTDKVTHHILLPLLSATLSAPTSANPSPESQLSALELRSGFLPSLFRLAISQDPSISLVSVVYLKNLVRREWQEIPPFSSNTTHILTCSIPDADRAFLRANIVPAMAVVHPRIRAQFAEAIKRIISADFPARFPELMPHILTALHSNQPTELEAGLIALRCLAKIYEFKGASMTSRAFDPEEALAADPRGETAPVDIHFLHHHPRAALNFIIKETFPTLLHIMRGLAQRIDEETQGGPVHQPHPPALLSGDKPYELQRIICKIFWSCTQYDLPAFLLNSLDGVFSDWMNSFLKAMFRPVQPPKSPQDIADMSEDDFRVMAEWKVKQWIGHIVYRLFQRYSNPSRLNQSLLRILPIEVLTKFGDFFRRNFAAPFTEAILAILSNDRSYMSPRVANLSLLYLESALAPGISYRVIKPKLEPLITNVIFPYMCISDLDLVLWGEDPIEYVHKTYDLLEDFNTPRAAACTLLYTMTKLRRSVVIAPLMKFLVQILNRYADTRHRLGHGEGNDARLQEEHRMLATQKDGALLAIGTVREALVAGDASAKYLRALLSAYVVEEFHSQVPFLRARACWLYGQLTASENISFEVTLPGLEGIQKCLGDKEFPVRVRAAADIRHFLHHEKAKQQIAYKLPDLLTLLFTLLDDIDSTDIVATIDQLVVTFSDQIAPYALPLVKRLVNTYSRAASAEQDDEEAGFAAMQCIQALESIVNALAESNVSHKISLLAETERAISEVFQHMFEEERIEHFEEALELLGMFVYHSATERGSHLCACYAAGVEPQEALLNPLSNPDEPGAGDLVWSSAEVRQAIQADVSSGAGVISPYLWSLFPLAMNAFDDWATDYSFHYLNLVDSYLSKAPRVFLCSHDGETSYVQLLLRMISRLWDDSSLDEDDYALQGSRVCGLLLQHCRDIEGCSIDKEVGILTELLVVRLRANSKSERAVNSLLTSLAHLMYVSPMTTLAVIDERLKCTGDVFALWMSMLRKDRLERDYDRKTSALALSAILGTDWNQLPVVLRQSIPQVLLTILQLLDSLAKSSNSVRHRIIIESEAIGVVEPSQDMGMQGCFSSGWEGDKVPLVGSSLAGCASGSNEMRNNGEMSGFSNPGEMSELSISPEIGMVQDADGDVANDLPHYQDVCEEHGDVYEDGEDGENSMFNVLQHVDELLYFESVISRLSPLASHQLSKALASDDTQRIKCTLHRAAELRTVMLNGVAKV